MKRSPQLSLDLPVPVPIPVRGGKRRGAGRKPKGPRALVSHKERVRFAKPTPVHVTLRARGHVWNLRSRRSFRRIQSCFEKSRGRFGVRLIEFSVQGNHLHLIVEADGNDSLSRAMQGLCIRIARALNTMMKRAGSVFSDHYHAHLLASPTELVKAIRYVLDNARHHFGLEGVDAFSSAALVPAERLTFLAAPMGWLLRVGWKRAKCEHDLRAGVVWTGPLEAEKIG